MMKNCVSMSEGHRELIQGFQNLRKDGQTDRQTDRQTDIYGIDVTNSEYENTTLIYSLRTV
jgi:hypothetical protein